jgi:NTE family protein
MATQFRNLVFEGGGVRGIAYVGAMRILQERTILPDIRRIGGASAGAINALVFALGYSLEEQDQLLRETEFASFMDDTFGFIRDIRRLAKEFGWHRGDFFDSWIGEVIARRLGTAQATFGELHEAGLPEVHVIGTNLSTGYSETFSHARHPEMPLAEAIRISMSIPLFFTAVRRGERRDVYVDGGVMQNYPVKLFDRLRYIDADDRELAVRKTEYYAGANSRLEAIRPGRSPYIYNRQTLGLRLDTREEIGLFRYDEPLQGKRIAGFTHYARALLGAAMKAQDGVHLHSDDWQRTVYIDTLEVGSTDFKVSAELKAALVEEGVRGVNRYFRWFDDPTEAPVNRYFPTTS